MNYYLVIHIDWYFMIHTVLNAKVRVAVGLVQAKAQAGRNVPAASYLLYLILYIPPYIDSYFTYKTPHCPLIGVPIGLLDV
jgi:hypothetical protein